MEAQGDKMIGGSASSLPVLVTEQPHFASELCPRERQDEVVMVRCGNQSCLPSIPLLVPRGVETASGL